MKPRHPRPTWPPALLTLLLSMLVGSAFAQTTLVPAGATWRWRKGTNEVSTPTSAWRAPGFNAAAWPAAPAPFHYGENLTGGTLLSDMRNGYTCLFLRHEFDLTSLAGISALRLSADYDDGFVAWINGTEIARSGVDGEPVYADIASLSHEGGSFVHFTPALPPATYLRVGRNVLAVQAFNRSLTASTDFRFDAEVVVDQADTEAPFVRSRVPAAEAVNSLTTIAVTFSEAVVGVQATDLRINGQPAAQVSGVPGASTYGFTFTEPAPGRVEVDWSEANRIADLRGNPFNTEGPGTTWAYELADAASPTLRALTPVAGATVSRLTQVELTFSEPVRGVDAADLRVNGQPATAVAGSGAGPYVFDFAPPAAGPVAFAWAAGHGIADTAATPNAFAGAGWTVTLAPALAAGEVAINEFLAGNQTGLRDEDGEPQDWIELYNRGSTAVNLLGWSLTDDAAAPGKWTFPARVLGPGQYLLVFASGKDRRTPSGANHAHANFKLNPFGEYLALYNAEFPRLPVSGFAPQFPEQRNDHSYGLDATGGWRYFATPTPRAANGASPIVGLAPPPHFSVGRGTFAAPFRLLLTAPLEGATFRYTTDGSEPTAFSGAAYTGPLQITNTTVLRAATFAPGHLPSRARTHTYLFLDTVLYQPAAPPGVPATWGAHSSFPNSQIPADYEMDLDPLRVNPNDPTSALDPLKVRRLQDGLRDLPVVSLVLNPADLFGANGLYPRSSDASKTPNPKACSVELIEPDGTTAFAVEGGLDVHGNASRSPLKNPKHGFKLSFKSDYGPTTLRHQLFPDSPAEEFDDLILRADFNSSWRHWSDSPGNGNGAYQRSRGTRTRYVWSMETFRAMGHSSSHGRFFHLFLNGLYWGTYDFCEQPTQRFAASYLGGEAHGYDIYDQGALRAGTATAYNAMRNVPNLASHAGYETIKQYLDVPQFIDYTLLHFYVGHQDWGANKNWYALRPQTAAPAGTFKYFPWDQECILLEENVNRVPNAGGSTDVPSGLHTQLDDNAQYRLDFADRAFQHLLAPGGALTPEANIGRWRKWQAVMDRAIVAESCRWGDYRRDVHRYSDGTYQLYTREGHWLPENERLVNSYFVNRGAVVLGQLRAAGLYPTLEAPALSQAGGRVPAGFRLTLSAPAGTVYYTTNGSDPRLPGIGTVSPQAREFREALTLEATVTLKARALQGGTWSALHEATFTVAELGVPVRFTEIMYRPPGGDAFEFLELQNVGAVPLTLDGYSLRGVEFIFPNNTTLPSGATVLLGSATDPAAFRARYPAAAVFGTFGGSLDNGGERIALVDRAGRVVTAVHYDDGAGWAREADGGGASLEVLDPRGDPSAAANWRASAVPFGTPGLPPAPAATPGIVLNEVLADNRTAVPLGTTFPDWIELHNRGDLAVDLGGWSLSDDGEPRKFVIPAGTTLGPQGYRVLWCDALTHGPGLHTGFALSRQGDTVTLFDAQTNRVDALSFGWQVPDFSIGRVAGAWALTEPTPGEPNRAAALASASNLALNEWLAAPEPGGDDWLELFNRSATAPVALRGLYLGTSHALCQLASLSFLGPLRYARLFADERGGPDHLEFRLPAAGGVIVLYDDTGAPLERVVYGPQVAGISEGRLPDGGATVQPFAGSVSPAAANYALAYRGPVLNEVLARNQRADVSPWGSYADWVELHNPGPAAADLGGFAIGRSGAVADRWTFPAGTTLPTGGWLVVWCDAARAASAIGEAPFNTGFALDGTSGEVLLFNMAGQAVDAVRYGFQLPDRSIGRSGGAWRLLDEPTPGAANADPAPLGSATAVRINEWMSRPLEGADWFELYNPGSWPVDLGGLFLTDTPSTAGLTNTRIAPLSFIGAGRYVQWVADADPAAGRHHVNFRLDALGETLRLYDANLALIDVVDYGLQMSGVSQGRLPDGGEAVVDFPASATPGAANARALPEVVISEVLTHTDPPFEDAIELSNLGTASVPIGGWYLSDTPADPKRYRIPDGLALAPGGYHVVYQNAFGTPDGEADDPPQFSLNGAHGDTVILSEADAAGRLTGRRSAVSFGAAANGVSFGRHRTSVGVDFVALERPTFGVDQPADVTAFRAGRGQPNAAPRVGPVVLTELMVAPAAGVAGDEASLEFIELFNLGAAPVPLYDPAHPAHRWRLADAVAFEFPAGTVLPAGGYLLVVGFDPVAEPVTLAAFRAAYGARGTVLGPYAGRLDNRGEIVELRRPDAPQRAPGPDAGYVPWVLVDRVAYADSHPWPTNATGTGRSLQRLDARLYGNDPAHWTAAAPTAGRGMAAGDTDGDGLPDDWERAYGTDPEVADAEADPDQDGMSNAAEFAAGTDPRSAQSLLALRAVAVGFDAVTLEFSAQPGRSYRVQFRDALDASPWIALTDVAASDAARGARVTDPAPSSKVRFYRVVTPVPPAR